MRAMVAFILGAVIALTISSAVFFTQIDTKIDQILTILKAR